MFFPKLTCLRIIQISTLVLFIDPISADTFISEELQIFVTTESSLVNLSLRETHTLKLKFHAENDHRISQNIAIDANITMPEHGHGLDNNASIKMFANDYFEISDLNFTMPGNWLLTIIFTSDNFYGDRILIPISVGYD